MRARRRRVRRGVAGLDATVPCRCPRASRCSRGPGAERRERGRKSARRGKLPGVRHRSFAIGPYVHQSFDRHPRHIHHYVSPAFADSLFRLKLLRASAASCAATRKHEHRGALYAVPRYTRNFLLSHKVRECLRRRSLIRGLPAGRLTEEAAREMTWIRGQIIPKAQHLFGRTATVRGSEWPTDEGFGWRGRRRDPTRLSIRSWK